MAPPAPPRHPVLAAEFGQEKTPGSDPGGSKFHLTLEAIRPHAVFFLA